MSKDLQRLLKKAQSKDDTERYDAVIEIADLAERAAIQPLMAMANDPSDDVKLAVASTLGFLGERFKDATPVQTLVEMFRNAGANNDLKLRIIESL
ncbi:MAG: HEAT repeat domain-containing protein, partial [Candidatus Sigynarchaeota archaeon]